MVSAFHRGFTLIELMVGLVLVAILMGIGLPMFRNFVQDQQLRATTSNLRIALTIARSEAVKRNRVVRLEPFDAGRGWGSGWIIPSPINGDPDILTHEQSGDVTIVTEPALASLQFSPAGRTAAPVDFEVDVGPTQSGAEQCMELALDGRLTSDRGACPDG